MLSGQIELGADTIRKMAQEKMKNEKTGFFSSDTQRELGSRPKKPRKPYAKNAYVGAALARGFALEHTATGEILTVEPFECANIVFVIDKLMSHPLMAEKLEDWVSCEKKEKHYGVSGLTRHLTGHIDEKTGKRLYSIMGWRVLGINSYIE
jgi:hypothetical protein